MTLKPTNLNSVGQKYQNFQIVKASEIAELQCTLLELVHLPTGAQVMHVANDDPENLFCLSFRTLPDSSNGAPHILEHTVLCGSKKYPVKDPFFSMTRRSLNTFMNALTGSDFTCYPAASQVPQDFYNLLEVYLDAVFHPLLNELSFLQEGHRLEFEVPNDPHTSLQRKGVVFNEMKGALASANARLAEAMDHALFPNLPYGYNSGGDPKVIPQLTYNDLLNFHERYYHPSRCLFFFYGNLPLEDHLNFIEKHALQGVKKVTPIPSLPMQLRFSEPRQLVVPYSIPVDEDITDKSQIAFGWLTCHILQQQELLALSVLEILLMDTDASPLKLAFLRSGLCKQATITTDFEVSEVPVMITLKGCQSEDADELEKILRNTLKHIIDEGISLDAIESAMHQVEFARSEITGNHTPFGLSIFLRSGLLKQHGGKPDDGLMIHSLFGQLRKAYRSDPHYFTDLIRKHFLDNKHFVRIVMLPDKELADKEASEEKLVLEKIRASLSENQKTQLLKQAAELAEFQKKHEDEDPNILPKIALSDVPKKSRNFVLTRETIDHLEIYHHHCFTNYIVYADLIFDLPYIKEEDLYLVRLLSLLTAQMGCGGRKYTETLEYIQAHTGGVGAQLSFNLQVDDFHRFYPAFHIRGKALHRKADKLFTLLLELANSMDLTDIDRLKEVILKHYTSLHGSLNQSALRYAISLSSSTLDVSSKISNQWSGIDYYRKIKELADDIDNQLPKLVEKLLELRRTILEVRAPQMVLTCDNQLYAELKQHDFYGLTHLGKPSHSHWNPNYPLDPPLNQGLIIATPVAFTASVFKTVPYVHPDSPALCVASALFENLVLHPIVREQGGAYGGGASFNSISGNFCFYAYRDPHISRTLQAFEEAIHSIASGDFDNEDLEEAKLEVFQGLDSPVAPGSRGDLAYSWLREDKTLEKRQAFRDRLFALTQQDVIAAINQYVRSKSASGSIVTLAGKDLLEKENALLVTHNKPPLIIETI